MTGARDRREELIAAAATDRLDAAEQRELDALARKDPSVLDEVAELREVMARLATIEQWHVDRPSRDLAERIAAATDELDDRRRAPRWRPALVAAAAVALLVAGGLGGAAIRGTTESSVTGAPSGPPGTLGAIETVQVRDVPDGIDLDAAVVAHTWGTEAIIDIEGVPVGETFEIVILDADGARLGAGGFLGAEAVVHCRLNAAVLRENAAMLRVERADGSVLGWGDLPPVGG